DLDNIVASADSVSSLIDAPVVTGDTKVMPKGELDGIIINVAGIGMAEQVIKNDNISVGDRLIVSGTVGDHGGAILAKRFGYQSDLVSDCAPVLDVMNIARGKAKAAKDPTRGGIAACLNEFADKAKVRILVDEEKIPVRRETKAICDILGLDPLNLACEGRVVFAVSSDVCEEVLVALREKYPGAADIGTAVEGSGVVMKTKMGTRFLDNPRGAGVPRIC
ncbi:MAG: AIR synthase-related protein, partial [archaeon]|nr:AIR synthase-related protein [archaeon]